MNHGHYGKVTTKSVMMSERQSMQESTTPGACSIGSSLGSLAPAWQMMLTGQ